VFLLTVCLIAGAIRESKAESPEAFYKGKTITWIVSSGAGSATDLLSRIAANFLVKEIGVKVKVENMGRNKGLNYAFTRSKGDGLTLASKSATPLLMNDLTNAPGIKYKCTEFNYIANMAKSSVFLFVKAGSPYTSIEALRKAKGFKAGGTSARGNMVAAASFVFEVLGVDGKVIPGYKNVPALFLALGQDEVNSIVIQLAPGLKRVQAGSITPLFIVGKEKSSELPDIQTLEEFGISVPEKWDAVRSLVSISGQAVVTTPGVPADRVQFLRKTFSKIGENKALQEEMEKVVRYWTPFEPGEKMQANVAKMMSNTALGEQLEKLVEKYSVAAK
jgi:tripartite-type tricarboxylate transporter receptor subunit TctC